MAAPYASLDGAGVFITGGATGIGAVLVERFAEAGARVAFNDIAADEGSALADRLGPGVSFHSADASDAEALQASVKEGARQLGRLDVLVNNVANDQREALGDITPQSWRRGLSVNLDPVIFASLAAIPLIKAEGRGAIVNFSSLNALLGPADLPTYTTAKAAILGLTKSMAADLGPDRIRVNAIIPGWVVTEKQKRLWLTPEAETAWKAQCCLKDDLLPDDIANLALFLAADESRMITSQGFVIDAGRT